MEMVFRMGMKFRPISQNPLELDTDEDGFSDFEEIADGANPLDSADFLDILSKFTLSSGALRCQLLLVG